MTFLIIHIFNLKKRSKNKNIYYLFIYYISRITFVFPVFGSVGGLRHSFKIIHVDRFRTSSGTTDRTGMPETSKANTIQEEKRTILITCCTTHINRRLCL